jgi:hypothetical protein
MLFQKQPDGNISNLYNFKIINKTNKEFPVHFRLENFDGTLKMVDSGEKVVQHSAILEGEFFVITTPGTIKERKTKITIGVYSGSEKLETINTTFMGPGGKYQLK